MMDNKQTVEVSNSTVEVSNSALKRVPFILQIMLDARFIADQSQRGEILAAQRTPKFQGMFVGDVAVAMGIVTAAQKDSAVGQQAIQIAKAAANDMRHLSSYRRQTLDTGNPYWGNDGQPNRPINNPTINDAASVLANVAKLITQLAHKNTFKMRDYQIKSPLEAVNLVNSMFKRTRGKHVFVGKTSDVQKVFAALKEVAAIDGTPKDLVEKYISHRSFEVFYGLVTPLAYAPPVILAFASGTILSSLAVGAGCALVASVALIGKDYLGSQVSHHLSYALIFSQQQFVDTVRLPCVGDRAIG